MAATEVGSAYVVIRAITTKLASDIKDGLDKGAKDADLEAAGRKIGERVGESSGESFGDVWTERSSEEIERSADSRGIRRASERFGDSLSDRFSAAFRRGADDASRSFSQQLDENLRTVTRDIDVDRAAGTLGEDFGDEVGRDFDASWKRNTAKTFATTAEDDSVRRGLSGFVLNVGESLVSGFAGLFSGGASRGIGTALSKFVDNIRIPGGIQWAVTLGLPALGAAAQTIGALAGSIVAVLGFIGTAAAGAGVALAGLGAAVAPAVFVLKSVFSAPSEELDAFNELLAGLKESWQDVGRAAQTELLPAIGDALALLTDEFLPVFTEYAADLGGVLAGIATNAATALTSSENKGRIQSILNQGLPIIETLGEAIVTMIDPILTILEAAMPLAQRLAASIGRVAQSFADFIENEGTEGLTERFDKWYDRFELIMKILGNIGKVIGQVFGAGADSADSWFVSLEKTTEEWGKFLETDEGQSKLKEFFESAKEVSSEVFGLLGDIVKLIGGPMTETGGTDSIVGFFRSIREDWLPTIVELGDQLGDALRGPAGDFIDILGGFLASLTESGAGVGFFQLLTSNLFVFMKVLEILTAFLDSEAGASFAKFALSFLLIIKTFKPILRFIGLLKPLEKLLNSLGKALLGLTKSALVKGLKALGQGIIFLGRAMIGFLAANPIVLLIAAIVAAITLLYFHFRPFRDFVDRYIIDPLQRLWEKIGGIEGIIDFFKDIGEAISNFFGGIKDAFSEGGIGGVFDFLLEQLGNLGGLLVDAGGKLISGLWQGIQAAWDNLLLPFFKSLPGRLFDFIVAYYSTIIEVGRTLLGKLWEGIQYVWDTYILPFFESLPETIVNLATGAGTWLLNVGEHILNTLWLGIQYIWKTYIWPFFENLPTTIVNVLTGVGNWLLDVGRNILNTLWWGITEIWDKLVKPFFENLPTTIVNLATGVGTWLLNLGRNILNTMWWGITEIWNGTILPFFGNLPDLILGAIGEVADFAGDLLSWGGELIGTIIRGIIDWIEDNVPGAGWLIDKLGLGEFQTEEEKRIDAYWENVGATWTAKAVAEMEAANEEAASQIRANAGDITTNFMAEILGLGTDIEAGEIVTQDQIAAIVSTYGDIGVQAGRELQAQIAEALSDNELSEDEINQILISFEEAFGEAGSAGAQGFMSNARAELDSASPLSFNKFARIEDRDAEASGEDIVTKLATAIGGLNELMVPAANQLVDRVLLTLARIHNEVIPTVGNPFTLKLVVGINRAAEEAVNATNRLVDRVLLTVSRIGNETTSKMNVFTLRLVAAINSTANTAVSATNSLVDRVLLTISRIGNEVAGRLSPVAGQMSNVLTSAGLSAANGFINGFKIGVLSLVLYLQGLDDIIRNSVGDLSDVLYNEGRQLMQGLLRGVRSAIGTSTFNVPLTFAHGGLVPGSGPQMAIVHGGEFVLTPAMQRTLGPLVSRWAGVASTSLRHTGQSEGWLYDLLTQMKHESGGRQFAINLWDSNFRKGTPSKGLMQVIDPTFRAFARELLERGIYDPLANIVAAIRYTLRRYGDLGAWRRRGFRGYAEGGIISAPTLALLGEAGREAVIPLTRRQQALNVMRQAGLDEMIRQDDRRGIHSSSAFPGGITDVAMLRIDHAEIYDKVDVDMIAARIRKAYTNLAGH